MRDTLLPDNIDAFGIDKEIARFIDIRFCIREFTRDTDDSSINFYADNPAISRSKERPPYRGFSADG